LDVGCGDGTWLSVFRKHGVEDITGIDGAYVSREQLQIPEDRFKDVNLAKPFSLGRFFDLAVCLEVAEHLPPECATGFIKSLAALAPVVLFSAAIPKQGGNHHINEQWPDYWASLFREHGLVPLDSIRKHVWQDDAVEFWYAQNTLLFVQANLLETNAAFKAEFERTNPNQLSVVHPRQLVAVEPVLRAQIAQMIPRPSGVIEASRLLLVCLRNAVQVRVQSMMGNRTFSKESQSSKAVTKP
jgi:cyclopropane fatty-acyl-phospholipid synthase-like methyltransferase